MKIIIQPETKRKVGISIFILLSIAFITLLILPADYFDTGRASCVSVILFDVECYGCGMTRAIQHLIHLDFESAWAFNKLSFIVFPLAIFMILWELKKNIFYDKSGGTT
jgi:hypothetical protein